MKKAIMIPLSIVLTIIILTSVALPIPGALAVDFLGGDKTLRVEVRYGGNALRDVNVGICRVATTTMRSNGRLIFEPVPEFVDAVDDWPSEMNLTAAQTRSLAEALTRYATNNMIERVVDSTDANGIVIFENLQNGVYLVMQERTAGMRFDFTPSLVFVGQEGVQVVVRVKGSYRTTPSYPSTTTPPTTTTPTTTEPPTTLPPTDIDSPDVPREPFPSPSTTPDIEITPPDVPLVSYPPDRIPTTGVIYWEIVIIILAALGTVLLVVGLIQKKRRDNRGN